MSLPAFDIIVAGEINPDLILAGNINPSYGQTEQIVENATLTIGSSSVILACGAARLGLRVIFTGVCGEDIFGRFMLNALQAHGVDTSQIKIDSQLNTGISVILNRGSDRAILTYLGAMASLQSEQVPDELLEKAKHIHVSSFFLQKALQPGLPDLFRRARSLNLSTSLDTNWDPSQEWQSVREVLEYTNLFMPNAVEACAIACTSDPLAAAVKLSLQAEIVAVKLGSQGALGVRKGEIIAVPAIPVNVLDTVGAGDSFDAGVIYGFLQGWELERSLKLGVVCGGLSTQAAGGTASQPTFEQALRLL